MGNNLSLCTIITSNYFEYALALHDSLIEHAKEEFHFSIFVSEGQISSEFSEKIADRLNIYLIYFEDIKHLPSAEGMKEKYHRNYHDAYRWGMKPILINFLLKSYAKVIYLDSDIYFFTDFSFLMKELNDANLLLTPHWRSSDPSLDYFNFKLNFLEGLFNAGFIGASSGAQPALDWWATMILFKCEDNRGEGLYDDQRYLDLIPILFEDIGIVKHKGCNVANWNQLECKRTQNEVGEVFINNKFQVVFIHFTNSMLAGILEGSDLLLKPHLEQYRDNLLKYSSIDIIEEFFKNGKFKKPRSEDDFKPQIQNFSLLKRSKITLKAFYKKLKKI